MYTSISDEMVTLNLGFRYVLRYYHGICNSILCSISRNLGTFLKNSEQISYQKIQIISELLGHVMLQLSRMLVCDVFVIFHVALFQL